MMQRHRPSTPRLHVDAPLASGTSLRLPESAARHAAQALRLRPGDPVVLFNGRGGEFAARIAAIARSGVIVEVGEFASLERESPLEVTLVQGLSQGDRMDLTVQKSVELGVFAIQPVATEKSVVRLAGERAAQRRAHWQRIAIAACEQCGRNRIPEIRPLVALGEYVPPAEACKLVLALEAGERLRTAAAGARSIVLAVGPEGGFSPAEQAQLAAAGFCAVRLGPRVLRTETAAPAALAALAALAGDF